MPGSAIGHKISIPEAPMNRLRIASLIVIVCLLGIPLTTRVGIRAAASPSAIKCSLEQYKASPGLTAAPDQNGVVISWIGQGGAELRARYGLKGGQPTIRDLGIRKAGVMWTILGENLVPEYDVVSGIRRLPNDQGGALQRQGIAITQEVIDKNRWYAFWDAPLLIPGTPQPAAGRGGQTATPAAAPAPAAPGVIPLGRGERVYGLPRKPEEIRRASATFNTSSCAVVSDGGSLGVKFPGLSMGIFAGDLHFTVYRGTNLIQMDAVAKTNEPWVAYKYDAGLKGFSTTLTPSVTWHDTGGRIQQYRFGGPVAQTMSALKAANRIIVAEGKNASLAAFPPPHTFFFTREKDTNLGYVWYWKDTETKFGIGVRMAESEEDPQYVENFALYNAPPATWQKMSVYFYAAAETAESSRQ